MICECGHVIRTGKLCERCLSKKQTKENKQHYENMKLDREIYLLEFENMQRWIVAYGGVKGEMK